MAIDLEKYNELKEQAENARNDVSKAEGALETHMNTLKEEFECDTIEEAEELLEKYKADEEKAEKAYNKALAEFEASWKKQFGDGDE